jgi:hypothetical protein
MKSIPRISMKIDEHHRASIIYEKGKNFSIELDGLTGALTLYKNGSQSPEKLKSQKSNKPRTTKVDCWFDQEVYVRTFKYDSVLSQLQLIGKRSFVEIIDSVLLPDTATLQHYYERKHKPKILCAAFFKNRQPRTNINHFLTELDIHFAIDTNTIEIAEIGEVSMTAVFMGQQSTANGAETIASNKRYYIEANIDVEGKAENFAWKNLIETIEKDEQFRNFTKIGIIVDSDLQELEQYNSLEKPLYSNFYLPNRFQLLYATDASGNQEFAPNKLISICDKTATEALDFVVKHGKLGQIDRLGPTRIEDNAANTQ